MIMNDKCEEMLKVLNEARDDRGFKAKYIAYKLKGSEMKGTLTKKHKGYPSGREILQELKALDYGGFIEAIPNSPCVGNKWRITEKGKEYLK